MRRVTLCQDQNPLGKRIQRNRKGDPPLLPSEDQDRCIAAKNRYCLVGKFFCEVEEDLLNGTKFPDDEIKKGFPSGPIS